MRYFPKQLAAIALTLSFAAPLCAQDLGGLLEGLGSGASDMIGGDGGLGGGLLDVQVLDDASDLLGNGSGTDLLLLGAPSENSPLQSENVDLLADDGVSNDLDAFNNEFEDSDTLRVNSNTSSSCEDSDRDSVCDHRDDCPETPPNQLVMPNGCGLDLQRPVNPRDFSSHRAPVAGVNVTHMAELENVFVSKAPAL